MFYFQCYFFIRNMVSVSQNFKLKSPNTWLCKLTADLEKSQRRRALPFLTWVLSLQSQRWLSCKFQFNWMFVRWSFNKNLKSIVLNFTYRPPNGDLNDLENHFKNIISKWEVTSNELVLMPSPVDTARKLNVHKTSRRRPGRLLNVLCTFNLRLCLLGWL